MGQVVDLHSRPIPLEDDEFCENLARFADGTLSEAAVKAKYHLSEEEWTALGTNDALVRRIEDRKLQRIRGGQTKRERAQIEVADAGPILGRLMRSPDSNARHVIDAVKTLDALAQPTGGEATAAGTRFEIRIDLSAGGEPQVLHFNKSIEINCNDIDPNDIEAGPQDVIAAIAMNKPTDGDNGGHL